MTCRAGKRPPRRSAAVWASSSGELDRRLVGSAAAPHYVERELCCQACQCRAVFCSSWMGYVERVSHVGDVRVPVRATLPRAQLRCGSPSVLRRMLRSRPRERRTATNSHTPSAASTASSSSSSESRSLTASAVPDSVSWTCQRHESPDPQARITTPRLDVTRELVRRDI